MKARNNRSYLLPVSLGALGLFLMSFAFGKKNDLDELPDLDTIPPPGEPGTGTGNPTGNGGGATQAGTVPLSQLFDISFSQNLFERQIITKAPTYYYKFTVQWIGGPNGSQMVITSMDKTKVNIIKDKVIGIASGYVIKEKSTGEVYLHTLFNGVNIVTPLEDVKPLSEHSGYSPAQSGIIGAYTYYFDQSYKDKNLYANKATTYQTFNAGYVAGPGGNVVLQIGNISQPKTWRIGDYIGKASGYIIESASKKYLHTLKNNINYATLL